MTSTRWRPGRRFLVTAILAAACGGSDAKPTATIDTLPGGAIRVVNHAPSAWADTNGWKLVLERTIAPADGAPGELSRPSSLAVTADGEIAVVDGSGAGLLVFNVDGTFAHQIGRAGEGPGEYSQFFDIDVEGSTVGISDCNHARAIRYQVDGTLLGQWLTHDCAGSTGIVLDEDGAWLGGYLRDRTGDREALLRWLADGTTTDTFLVPPRPEPHIWQSPDGAAIPIPFSPWQVSTGNPNAWWQGVGDEPTVVRLSRQGDTLRIVTLAIERAAIPDSVRVARLTSYQKSPRFAAVARLDDVPTAQPYFTALDLDESGDVWVSRPRTDGSVGSFEVIDSTGRWLGTVAAPQGRLHGLRFRNGRMYGITETADGLPAIEVYRIDQTMR